MNKKGFELAFHWIFILIAGGIILAFFFSVANKQKNLSQERLELTLSTEIENIFTGAIISKGTAQKIPVPSQGIEFECTEGCDCKFKIKNAQKPFGEKSIFAPKTLQNQDITVWALEFKEPFRATNFLFLTNPEIKYYFVYDEEPQSKSLLNTITKNIPPLIEYETITQTQMSSIKEENYENTRFILLNLDPTTLDDSFKRENADAVKITQTEITFYEKDKITLIPVKTLPFLEITSIYAAIFSQNDIMYECGMKTAFRKLSQISQLYKERTQELQKKAEESGKDWCQYQAGIELLNKESQIAKELSKKLDNSKISTINQKAGELQTLNRYYVQQSCPEIF